MALAFPELVEDLAKLPDLVLDGELVILDTQGHPQFEQLRRRALMSRAIAINHAAQTEPAAIVAFDLLMLEGKDLRKLPLLRRKAALKGVLKRTRRILFADHIGVNGERLYAKAVELELGGIVAKRTDSTYTAGRSHDWVRSRRRRAGCGRASEWNPWRIRVRPPLNDSECAAAGRSKV